MDENIKNRIKKLLALGSENENENEARAAMKKAATLAAEHGMSISDIDIETGEVSNVNDTTLQCSHKRNKGWESILASSIAMCFDLEVVLQSNRYTVPKWVFFGTPSDMEMGLWYFKYIRMYSLRSAKTKFSKIRDQVAYCTGIITTVNVRIRSMFYEEKVKMESEQTKALVVVKKDEVTKKVKERFPRLRRKFTNISVNQKNKRAYSTGQRDGQTMPLNKGFLPN